MRYPPASVALLMLPLVTSGGMVAQTWNTDDVSMLIDRASARRAAAVDRGFADFTAHAQGFVLFLAQTGEGLTGAPRLLRADQLALEVYWKAPGASKQRIVGRRDQIDLPTGIVYHPDHLGIVQNNYADRIRIGNCDEICDVPHPLSRQARALYDYAIVDSLRISFIGRQLDVYEVAVRPKEPHQPRVVGTLYIDAGSGQVVRLRFGFTRASYRDDALEDITVLLDNALWEGRHWLPRHQEIEVRRRSALLDLPTRGIIRTVLSIEAYEFDVGLNDSVFDGPEIVQAPEPERLAYPWPSTLREALGALPETAQPATLDEARQRMREIVSERVLSGLPRARAGAAGVSHLARFNRVEGLRLGAGAVVRPWEGRVVIRGWGGYGFGDERAKGRLSITWPDVGVSIRGSRDVRDLSDEPVVSGVVGSLLAQEAGRDFGDYYLREAVEVGLEGKVALLTLSARAGLEKIVSTPVTVGSATGSLRQNPDFGSGTFKFFRGEMSVDRPSLGSVEWSGHLSTEVGVGEADETWARVTVTGAVTGAIGPAELTGRAWMGVGTTDLPAYRSFAVGGRGTLVGLDFRAWGGRWAVVTSSDLLFPIPVPEIGLGSFGSTGRHIWFGPYIGAVLAGRSMDSVPWEPSGGARPVIGGVLELFHRLIRVEVGYSTRDADVRAAFDVRRAFWPIL
jgi:hypothetical protein